MLNNRAILSALLRRVMVIGAFIGLLHSIHPSSAHAEEYWRGRNHPQPRQMSHSHHGWCERDWRHSNHHQHYYRHHHGHHYPRYTRIIVQRPIYRHPPVVIYQPYHHR